MKPTEEPSMADNNIVSVMAPRAIHETHALESHRTKQVMANLKSHQSDRKHPAIEKQPSTNNNNNSRKASKCNGASIPSKCQQYGH
jgi:hypothetical protein